MKLLEAMRIINGAAAAADRPVRTYALACGFTPLALETFLRAELQQRRPDVRVALEIGRFGDLAGSIERMTAADEPREGLVVVIEWPDLDPRLGVRNAASIAGATFLDDVVRNTLDALERLRGRVERAAAALPVVVSLPTLPLPPVFHVTAGAAAVTSLRLRAAVAAFAADLAGMRNVRVVDSQTLDRRSPTSDRHDVSSDLLHGFPYTRTHAGELAAMLTALLHPAPTRKGIITDLDETLWRGIVGEIGVGAVCWGLEHGAQSHALYQQCLASLADAGVLVAVASKNDPTVVAEALRRADLLVSPEQLFPVHASWGPKSAAVAEILAAWNVGADSIVFVDDSPLEIAEVQQRFPEIEGLLFRAEDGAATLALIERLRELFGRDEVREEDRLRTASLRSAAELRTAAASADDDERFLAGLDAEITMTLSRDASDGRAIELVNKTNQFNLNGRRYTSAEWTAALDAPNAMLATVAYRDKFGPLGKIAVAVGRVADGRLRLDSWVMSCRAFSRRIEHHTALALLDALGADTMELDFVPTPRNGPLQEFLAAITGVTPTTAGPVTLTRAQLEARSPALQHRLVLERTDTAPALSGVGRPSPVAD